LHSIFEVGDGFDGALTSLMSKIPGTIFSSMWAGLVERPGEMKNAHLFLLEKSEGSSH
jgi:hypothetical protein